MMLTFFHKVFRLESLFIYRELSMPSSLFDTKHWRTVSKTLSQQTFTCLKSIIETPEVGVKYVQS